MNVEEALHCSACGRDLGLEPIGAAAELLCPHDKEALVAFDLERGRLFDCGACGGQFVQHDTLRTLLQRHEVQSVAPVSMRRPGTTADAVRYVPCPVCKALMNRKNFGTTSGVIVDVCKAHGTWFDAGELPRVLAFAAGGGLEAERRRQLEEAERKKRESIAAAASAQSFGSASMMPVHTRSDVTEHLAQMLIDFLVR